MAHRTRITEVIIILAFARILSLCPEAQGKPIWYISKPVIADITEE